MLTFSKFDDRLPEELRQIEALHLKIRSGTFGTLDLAGAEQAYIQALLDTPDSPLSVEMKELMGRGVAVNRILEYVTDEFTGYGEQMNRHFEKHAWVYPDFANGAMRAKITERLQREDLDRIELHFTHHGIPDTLDLTGLSKMKLAERFVQFWNAIAGMTQHNASRNCNMEVQEIVFVY